MTLAHKLSLYVDNLRLPKVAIVNYFALAQGNYLSQCMTKEIVQ